MEILLKSRLTYGLVMLSITLFFLLGVYLSLIIPGIVESFFHWVAWGISSLAAVTIMLCLPYYPPSENDKPLSTAQVVSIILVCLWIVWTSFGRFSLSLEQNILLILGMSLLWIFSQLWYENIIQEEIVLYFKKKR